MTLGHTLGVANDNLEIRTTSRSEGMLRTVGLDIVEPLIVYQLLRRADMSGLLFAWAFWWGARLRAEKP